MAHPRRGSGGVAEAYRERRQALLTALAGHGIAAHGDSGVNVWVAVPEETAVVVGLLQRGWAVTPGAAFRVQSPPGIRITVSRLDPVEAPGWPPTSRPCWAAPRRAPGRSERT